MLTRNITCTLRPLSTTFRRKVRAAYRGPTKLNREARKTLASVIFSIENDLEHRSGSQHPQVLRMRAVRNVLLDECGEQESLPTATYPQHDEARALISERRRKGNIESLRRAQEAKP